jgi:hypothetical protein
MAVTVTAVSPQGTNTKAFTVIATADGDTTATIVHGFGVAPFDVSFVPLLAAAYTSVWTVTTIDATNVVLTKGTGAGSGNASPQLRVTLALPHSIAA